MPDSRMLSRIRKTREDCSWQDISQDFSAEESEEWSTHARSKIAGWLCTYPVSVAFWRGNVVLDGTRNRRPHGVDQSHDMVTQLAAGAVQEGVLIRLLRDDDAQLRHTGDVRCRRCRLFQLPAQSSHAITAPKT